MTNSCNFGITTGIIFDSVWNSFMWHVTPESAPTALYRDAQQQHITRFISSGSKGWVGRWMGGRVAWVEWLRVELGEAGVGAGAITGNARTCVCLKIKAHDQAQGVTYSTFGRPMRSQPRLRRTCRITAQVVTTSTTLSQSVASAQRQMHMKLKGAQALPHIRLSTSTTVFPSAMPQTEAPPHRCWVLFLKALVRAIDRSVGGTQGRCAGGTSARCLPHHPRKATGKRHGNIFPPDAQERRRSCIACSRKHASGEPTAEQQQRPAARSPGDAECQRTPRRTAEAQRNAGGPKRSSTRGLST